MASTRERQLVEARPPQPAARRGGGHMNVYAVAFVWVSMALVASLASIRVGLSVALLEILVGAIAGNLPLAQHYIQQTAFTSFLASLGPVMLMFLAGAE